MIIKKLTISLIIVFSLIFISSNFGLAQSSTSSSCSTTFFGLPTWYQYLNLDPENCRVLDNQQNVPALIILGFISIAIRLAGILAVFMIIWGGYKFIFSDGNSDQVAGARKTILNAVIGLIIVILATPLVNFVAGRLSAQ